MSIDNERVPERIALAVDWLRILSSVNFALVNIYVAWPPVWIEQVAEGVVPRFEWRVYTWVRHHCFWYSERKGHDGGEIIMLLFSTRLCGLVGIVGSSPTSSWAWGYCGLVLDELVGLSVYRAADTRVLYVRRNLLYSFILGNIEFSKRKKNGLFITCGRLLDR